MLANNDDDDVSGSNQYYTQGQSNRVVSTSTRLDFTSTMRTATAAATRDIQLILLFSEKVVHSSKTHA